MTDTGSTDGGQLTPLWDNDHIAAYAADYGTHPTVRAAIHGAMLYIRSSYEKERAALRADNERLLRRIAALEGEPLVSEFTGEEE